MDRLDILLAKPSGDNPLTDSFLQSAILPNPRSPDGLSDAKQVPSVVFAGFAATSLASRIGEAKARLVMAKARLVITADAAILTGNLVLELCLQD